MKKLKLLSLFSGIGAFEKALDRLGVEYELEGYSEIDKYASRAYALIYDTEDWTNLGDVTKIDETKLAKDIDLITYGFPCQDISLAGNQKGLTDKDGNKTRSGLVWDATRIIRATQPKVAIAENVKNLVSKKFTKEFEAIQQELEDAGYNNYWKVLNAKEHGIAQNRERVFIVSIRKDIDLGLFEFPETEELKTRLLDYLEDEVDEKYYLSDEQIKRITQSTFQTNARRIHDPNRIVGTLCARDYKDPKCVDLSLIQVGQMYGTEKEPNPQAGRIYDPTGISPTLDAMQGGNRMPKIIMPEKTKKGYTLAEEGDGVYLDRPHQKRGVVQKGLIQTIKTSGSDVGVVVKDPRETIYSDKSVDKILSNIVDVNGVSKTITANPQRATIDSATLVVVGEHRRDEGIRTFKDGVIGTLRTKDAGGDKVVVSDPPLRVRKLTPKECWRLMGFDDEDHDKVEADGISNSQRYKMAGNSIVVNVVEKILKNLIDVVL